MGFFDDASGMTRVTLTVFESAGMVVITVSLAASLAVAFGIGRLVERASHPDNQRALDGRSDQTSR